MMFQSHIEMFGLTSLDNHCPSVELVLLGLFPRKVIVGLCFNRQIIEWAKDPTRGVGPFYSQLMEQTHFVDLNARLGQAYCYVHQGDCEHIMIFTDLRLVDV